MRPHIEADFCHGRCYVNVFITSFGYRGFLLFPSGEHDDQVDAVSGVYQVVSKHPQLGGGAPSIFG